MAHSTNLRGILCMLMAAVTFVSNDSFLKLAVGQVPPLQALFLRGVVALIWCLILVIAMGYLRQVLQAFSPWTVARSLCETVAVIGFIFALQKVPLADISAIYQIAPLIVLGGASVIWHEHIGPLRWMLIGLGVTGALLVAQPGGAGASPYALLGFVTAFGSAVRDLLSRHVPDRTPGLIITLSIIFVVMATAGIGTLLFGEWVPLTQQTMLYSLGSGFFLVFGQFFVFMAFRLATARAVAPFYYTITLTAVLFGAVFFGEFPNTLAVGGILLIIACGLGVLVLEGKKEERL